MECLSEARVRCCYFILYGILSLYAILFGVIFHSTLPGYRKEKAANRLTQMTGDHELITSLPTQMTSTSVPTASNHTQIIMPPGMVYGRYQIYKNFYDQDLLSSYRIFPWRPVTATDGLRQFLPYHPRKIRVFHGGLYKISGQFSYQCSENCRLPIKRRTEMCVQIKINNQVEAAAFAKTPGTLSMTKELLIEPRSNLTVVVLNQTHCDSLLMTENLTYLEIRLIQRFSVLPPRSDWK